MAQNLPLSSFHIYLVYIKNKPPHFDNKLLRRSTPIVERYTKMRTRPVMVFALLLLMMVASSCSAMEQRAGFMVMREREGGGRRLLREGGADEEDNEPLQYSGSIATDDNHHGIPLRKYPP
ncbi:uncharacterized protein LOC116209240 [Punica granatum]|uniref:Uncharacterized protein LOC116209240 n=2 Tax=Punica granatum TaxID=22663 RepID=A0A6P8DWC6_PUNGR|nr:uncharacterized protein LOC116209240 [Punica granatum]